MTSGDRLASSVQHRSARDLGVDALRGMQLGPIDARAAWRARSARCGARARRKSASPSCAAASRASAISGSVPCSSSVATRWQAYGRSGRPRRCHRRPMAHRSRPVADLRAAGRLGSERLTPARKVLGLVHRLPVDQVATGCAYRIARVPTCAAIGGDDRVATNGGGSARALGLVEMTADGITNHRVQLVLAVRLGEDRMADGRRDEAAVAAHLTTEADHRTLDCRHSSVRARGTVRSDRNSITLSPPPTATVNSSRQSGLSSLAEPFQ